MAGKRANGEGSIYQRSNGRWVASVWVDTISGKRKRINLTARTRAEAAARLADKIAEANKGIRAPDQVWTVGSYLDYWLSEVVAAKNRPRTAELYESTIRLHLQPALGNIRLTKLTVPNVQSALNARLNQGGSVRSVHLMRTVLRTALSRAEREELVVRNVAKLTELPTWERDPIQPWTADQATKFLTAARTHRWYAAYTMLLIYGMRRGEVLGLRWRDIDFTNRAIHVRQQLQRIGGTLQQGPVKTAAGRRDLPLLPVVGHELLRLAASRYGCTPTVDDAAARAAGDASLVFLSSTGTPVDPKNFVRTFHEIRAGAGLPRITVHHTRHTAATLLKNLGVPARDAQIILGHAHVTTTQQIYQHGDLERQTDALVQVEQQLVAVDVAAQTAATAAFSTGESTITRALTSGGPGGARTLDTLLKRQVL